MPRAPVEQMLFYAQYGRETGLGHVVRSAALSLACRLRGAKTTLIEQADSPLPAFVSSLYSLVLPETRALETAANSAGSFVVDGYAPDKDVLARLRKTGLREVWICDDLQMCPDDADVALHPIFGPAENATSDARHLTGSAYALLRPAFAERRAKAAKRSRDTAVSEVFVCLGGTDASGLLPRLVPELLSNGYRVSVALSELSSSFAALRDRADTSRESLRLVLNASDTQMAEEMLRADVTIGNAGSSSFERCTLGAPSLIIIVADNQVPNAEQLQHHGAAILAGSHDTADIVQRTLRELEALGAKPERSRTMSLNAFRLCDGLGAFRCAGELLPERSHAGQPVRLRPAADDDCRMIYDWQQLPETRAHARNPVPPAWDEHVDWFSKKIADPCTVFSVIEVEDAACGVVRLDYLRHRATRPIYEVSIFLHPGFFGKGIASAALRAASSLMPFADIQATVLPGNDRSLQLFRSAGYVSDNGALLKRAAIDAFEEKRIEAANE